MNTHLHLEESLQRDIDTLRNKVAEMGRLAERALQTSVRALVQGDRRLAYSVILRDHYLDELETELDRLCLEFLVRQQPAGSHLRLAFAVIQINKELERIGDYAESIGRQVLTVSALERQPSYSRFIELGDLAVRMLRDALQAFRTQDADLAWRTIALEEQANSLRNIINEDLTELARSQRLASAALNPLLTVARRLERTADQVKNFCEDVLYLCTGDFIKHKGADSLRVLFFDVTNSCLSQMAEGLGRSLRLPRFSFASAGFAPQPIEPSTARFLADKGIDISFQTSKSLEQVTGWETYPVIIALGARSRAALAPRFHKTIVLTWLIPDPAEAAPGDRPFALQTAYQALESQLKELVEAILDEPNSETKS